MHLLTLAELERRRWICLRPYLLEIRNADVKWMSGDTEGIPRCVNMDIWRNDRRAPAGGILQPGKIEAWVSVASEYGEELLQEELMESGNAGNPDLNHNTCLARKLETVQASSVIKSYVDGWIVTRWRIYPNQGIHLVIDATHPHARLVSEESRKRADGPVSAWNGACAQRANKQST